MRTHALPISLLTIALGFLGAAGCQTDIAALELSGPPVMDSEPPAVPVSVSAVVLPLDPLPG